MSTTSPRRTVLITGCSEGGLGFGLAEAFHARGLRVLATARNPSKMSSLQSLGIETFTLDVLSQDSINSCVSEVSALTGGTLDFLVNNAGGGYSMPVADIDIEDAKQLFDLNVWSYITVAQAFLSLLIKAKGTLINNTSISSVIPTPYSSVYQASKAAAPMFSDHMRLELEPFGIKVIDLKTGSVHTKFHANKQGGNAVLPKNSIYDPIREETEKAMGNSFPDRMDLDVWSKLVVDDVLKRAPAAQIWRGKGAWEAWFSTTFVSHTWFDRSWRRLVGLDLLARRLRESGKV
jgi:1-acylglycerone phosphate reductase